MFGSYNLLYMYTSEPDMCERCDGLCCRVYDIFDQKTGRLVKRAGDKCGYLNINNRCLIHTSRHRHPGYCDSCEIYDCLGGWPIVTTFARRIPDEYQEKYAITSSLLESIRIAITGKTQIEGKQILLYAARELNGIHVDNWQKLLLSVKVLRAKIENFHPESIELEE